MKTITLLLTIFISINLFANDAIFNEDISNVQSLYRINKDDFNKGTDERVYSSFLYPYFKYPFHYSQDVVGYNITKNLWFQTKDPRLERYPKYCDIMWVQPEFNLLKRLFKPSEFSFKKIAYDVNDGAEGGGLYRNFSQLINCGKATKASGTMGYGFGQMQGFVKGLYYDFDFYICQKTNGEMQGHKFLIAIPKYVKVNNLTKCGEAGILFIGTSYDFESKDVGQYRYNEIIYKCYPVIDFVVLYDKRLCKDYIW